MMEEESGWNGRKLKLQNCNIVDFNKLTINRLYLMLIFIAEIY